MELRTIWLLNTKTSLGATDVIWVIQAGFGLRTRTRALLSALNNACCVFRLHKTISGVLNVMTSVIVVTSLKRKSP